MPSVGDTPVDHDRLSDGVVGLRITGSVERGELMGAMKDWLFEEHEREMADEGQTPLRATLLGYDKDRRPIYDGLVMEYGDKTVVEYDWRHRPLVYDVDGVPFEATPKGWPKKVVGVEADEIDGWRD
jgi:hypothetical protein